jgi:hypothetical protein
MRLPVTTISPALWAEPVSAGCAAAGGAAVAGRVTAAAASGALVDCESGCLAAFFALGGGTVPPFTGCAFASVAHTNARALTDAETSKLNARIVMPMLLLGNSDSELLFEKSISDDSKLRNRQF